MGYGIETETTSQLVSILHTIWSGVLTTGSISGLIALTYTIFSNIRKRPQFKFEQTGFSGYTKSEDKTHASFTFQGILSNVSMEPNTIKRIILVVWKKRKYSAIRFGWDHCGILDKGTGQSLSLPLRLDARDSKNIRISYNIPTIGNEDRKIIFKSDAPGGWVSRNWIESYWKTLVFRIKGTYKQRPYEIAILDVNDNLFDMYGQLCSRKEIDQHWVTGNYYDYKRWLHNCNIVMTRIRFYVRRCARYFGFF
ncbi:MAG: hypothetical protein WCV88_05695 [Patescibacteria group bacterium]|jgi:hypothetical protein